MAYLGNIPPPSCIGFTLRPHLQLPLYIQTEVHTVQLYDGSLLTRRRPRPLSIVAGAKVVLQADQDLLGRFVHAVKIIGKELYSCV